MTMVWTLSFHYDQVYQKKVQVINGPFEVSERSMEKDLIHVFDLMT